MPNALNPILLHDLRDALRTSSYFESDERLYALFVDTRIITWHDQCRAASNVLERVDFLIETLYNNSNKDGENALVLFLEVLKEEYQPQDARHEELKRLIQRLATVPTAINIQSINIPFVNRDYELEKIKQDTLQMQYWVIYGPEGYGKTTFLNKITQYYLSKNWVCAQVEIPRDYPPRLRPLVETILQTLGEPASLKKDSTVEDMVSALAGCIMRHHVPGNGDELTKIRGYGVALVLDNVDALDDTTLEQFIKIIGATYNDLCDSSFFENAHRFCLLMASRDARRVTEFCKRDMIMVRELGLSPYTYKYVYETVKRYMLEIGMPLPLREERIQDITSQLLYFGGGHPGCIATLLTDLAQTRFAGYRRFLADKGQITKPVFAVLESFKAILPDSTLLPVLEVLSVFRRIDRSLLRIEN